MALASNVELFVLVMEKHTNKQKQYGRARGVDFICLHRTQYFYKSPFLGKISMIWSLGNLKQKK